MSSKENSMSLERFAALLANEKWLRVDEMIEALDDNDYWDEDFLAAAEEHAKKDHCRRMARALRVESGDHRIFASLLTTTESGEKVRVYKQETLFNVDDYRQVVNSFKGNALHLIAEANGYARRGTERFRVQIPLPFPTFSGKVS